MKRYYLIILLNFISSDNWSQLHPIIEADYTFCYFCSNDHVVDKVWRFKDEIYTKLRTENFDYELFRLSDTVFQVRKYNGDMIIEEGKLLLKRDNIIDSDTVSCYHCVPGDDINGYVFVNQFVRPIKYEKWKIYSQNFTASGKYDTENRKIDTWSYEYQDSTIFYNHDNKEFYYYTPNSELVIKNLNLLFNKFYVSCGYFGPKHGLKSYLNSLNGRFSIKLEQKRPEKERKSYLEFHFFQDYKLTMKLYFENEIKFEEYLTWNINPNGEITIIHPAIEDQTYMFWTLGKERISFRSIDKK